MALEEANVPGEAGGAARAMAEPGSRVYSFWAACLAEPPAQEVEPVIPRVPSSLQLCSCLSRVDPQALTSLSLSLSLSLSIYVDSGASTLPLCVPGGRGNRLICC